MSERSDLLRWIADLLDAKPDLPLPTIGESAIRFDIWYAQHKANVPEEVHYFSKLIGGQWSKNDPKLNSYHAQYYELTNEAKAFGRDVIISAQRNAVCERVEVGAREVIIPAEPAKPATEEQRIVQPVYEWQCIPLNRAGAELTASSANELA